MTTASAIAAELARTAQAQAAAADPTASVWVSANAGTGKTHVLTMRVLRLMLAGTPPERILCLTYTKAAAAEMAKRVFGTLARWVTIPEPQLVETLSHLTGEAPQPDGLARARTLFASAIETPGGLKVQTIHAFCERLLQRFPLEAGISAGFTILDDETADALRREAIDAVLTRTSREPQSSLGRALNFAIAYAADDRFDEILAATLPHRVWLIDAVRMDDEPVSEDPAFSTLERLLRETFSVRPYVELAELESDLANCLSAADLARVRDILLGGGKSDTAAAAKLSVAIAAPSLTAKCAALEGFFLTADGSPRDRLATKALLSEHPDLDPTLKRAQSHCASLASERASLRAVTATIALHRLAYAVHDLYDRAKARRAALDFDDLVERTKSLLATSEAADWVLYKLDGGLDHLLVDESQDTSPAQWSVIASLAREFFSGSGAREQARTLFAVGDEKQSIYSFQGAVPEEFAEMGHTFSASAYAASISWRAVPLDMSFRSAAPILEAVDAVFADPYRTPGVASDSNGVHHIAKRHGQAGLVEIWPTEKDAGSASGDVWSPFAEPSSPAPAVRLAARIAATIHRWLDKGEELQSERRPVRAGDILILVRKRFPLAAPMVAELKKLGIPVAGADRIQLSSQIGVQDLIALGDFLTLPEDDLALATVLKSPMFGLNDDDLMVLAPGRKGTLWKALLDNAAVNRHFAPAAEILKRWRKSADFTPPFEFFAGLLDNEGMRHKLLARLGPDAADAIDEFLNLALMYDDDAPPSLAGFVHWLRDDTRVVKRDMEQGRDEVRVMTVHGAKGLEAPIVFLPDTCTTAAAGRRGGPLPMPDLDRPQPTAEPFVWQVKGASKLPPIAAAKAAQDAKERAERDRLLYVAMTRARDRLYISGFEGKLGRDPGCWYDLVNDALSSRMRTFHTLTSVVQRMEAPQIAKPDAPKHAFADATPPAALPAWAMTRAPRDAQLSVPLAPSRIVPYETDDTGEPSATPPPTNRLAEPPPLTPAALADQGRFLRGTLTHALLEHLPNFASSDWARLAKTFVTERGAGLARATQTSIVDETLRILTDPSFAPLFGPASIAEAPIIAMLPRPSGDGPPLRLTGQIDRLVDTGSEVLIVDYKTNRPPPASLDQVADAYIYQLTAYRLALAAIYPDRTVRAAILWTDGPRIMEIPQDRLISYAKGLWSLDKPTP